MKLLTLIVSAALCAHVAHGMAPSGDSFSPLGKLSIRINKLSLLHNKALSDPALIADINQFSDAPEGSPLNLFIVHAARPDVHSDFVAQLINSLGQSTNLCNLDGSSNGKNDSLYAIFQLHMNVLCRIKELKESYEAQALVDSINYTFSTHKK